MIKKSTYIYGVIGALSSAGVKYYPAQMRIIFIISMIILIAMCVIALFKMNKIQPNGHNFGVKSHRRLKKR